MDPVSYFNIYDSALTLLISALNLFFIIYFYQSSRKYNLSKSRYEKMSIQFRELIFEPNQDKIETFYIRLYKRIQGSFNLIKSQIQNDKDYSREIKDLILFINQNRTELRKSIGDSIFAFDEDFGKEFYELLDNLQDSLTPKISNIRSIEDADDELYEDILRDHKIKTFKALHSYEPFDLEEEHKFKFNDPLFIVFIFFVILFMLIVFGF